LQHAKSKISNTKLLTSIHSLHHDGFQWSYQRDKTTLGNQEYYTEITNTV